MTNTTQPSCKGLAGFLFGHDFQGRYSEETTNTPLTDIAIQVLAQEQPADEYFTDILKAAKSTQTRNLYLHDVCTRCGLTIKP